jgi:hypothetical protein
MRLEHLASDEALASFLLDFESGALPRAEWTHGAHVAAAATYLYGSDAAAVLPLMRRRIRAFNLAVGGANTPTSGYHETLTRFWLIIVEDFLHRTNPNSPLEAARLAVAEFGEQRAFHTRYYSGNVVQDTDARLGWKEPNLEPLPTPVKRIGIPAHPLD